ncbi:hypothetical protein AB1Y20_010787 [Prymnesium parvum]|uniref:Uncharacterized protein n=1 Tax=Prymnesium parvum TaxID=97485 RepID=A0AB34IPQ8_PRYPA
MVAMQGGRLCQLFVLELHKQDPQTRPHSTPKKMSDQTYDEVCDILRSLHSVKDVIIQIDAAYWGVEWAI